MLIWNSSNDHLFNNHHREIGLLDGVVSNATDNDGRHAGGYLENNSSMQLFFAFILLVSAIFGIFGNILIILTVAMTKTLRIPSNMFIINLAIADLIVTTVVDPFNVIGAFVGAVYFEENHEVCEMIASLCAPACMCSILNICAISVNRYILICHFHHYGRMFTWSRTVMMCLVLWIVSYVMHLPSHTGWGHNKFDPTFYICTFALSTYSYTVFYILFGVGIPLVIVLFSYASIFHKYWQVKTTIRDRRNIPLESTFRSNNMNLSSSTNDSNYPGRVYLPLQNLVPESINNDAQQDRNKNTSSEPSSSSTGFTADDIKLAKTLFSVFIAFLICWAPFSLLALTKQPASIPGWIYMIAIIMAHGNSSINSILYGLTNEKFRQGYRNVLGLQPKSGAHRNSDIPVEIVPRLKYLKSSSSSKKIYIAPTVTTVEHSAICSPMKKSTRINKDSVKKKEQRNLLELNSQLLSPNGIVIIVQDSP